MAQRNITLDQDEIPALLAQDSSNAFRTLLQEALNAVLRAESANQLRAEPCIRTEERTDMRKREISGATRWPRVAGPSISLFRGSVAGGFQLHPAAGLPAPGAAGRGICKGRIRRRGIL